MRKDNSAPQRRLIFAGMWAFIMLWAAPGWAQVDHVVLISFDGLRPDAVRHLRKKLPHFDRVLKEGVHTFNARTDVDYTNTLPNHTCMLTGRGVTGESGHGVMLNTQTTETVHAQKGEYVPGIFDVLHEHGLTSAMYASKLKFQMYADSYPIDRARVSDYDDEVTLQEALRELSGTALPAFLFVHFSNPDHTGHAEGWKVEAGSAYLKAVRTLDGYLGRIMDAIGDRTAKGERIVVIMTTDHGGTDKDHGEHTDGRNYTIPFFVWGTDVARGKDLYKLNADRRFDPGNRQIAYGAQHQPVRNGDAANLALHLLGLSCVPQSTIGCAQALQVR